MHFYNNMDDCTTPGVVPAARLLSEFGWQSDAPFFSIKHVTPSEDWDTWWAPSPSRFPLLLATQCVLPPRRLA